MERDLFNLDVNNDQEFNEFKERFKLLASKNKHLIINTLSNIFTMRLIGNKTHGDLAEIGISEFINQFMYDFQSKHVGKDLYRKKSHEEDIVIFNEITKKSFPLSLKAYGDGPLQLSTDKTSKMFSLLSEYGREISTETQIKEVFSSSAFTEFDDLNVMPLIYDEKNQKCNIMIFNKEKAKEETGKILLVNKKEKYCFDSKSIINTTGRDHPIYLFIDKSDNYICEVRYGGTTANALQRGLWTHTKNALSYFDSITNGWISYKHNLTLVKLFSLALNSTEEGHKIVNTILQDDINKLKLK